jgi:predicted transcriptional regulator
VGRKDARRNVLTRLVDKLFHGSAEQLVAHLVEDEAIDAKDLERLREMLNEKPAKRQARRGRK